MDRHWILVDPSTGKKIGVRENPLWQAPKDISIQYITIVSWDVEAELYYGTSILEGIRDVYNQYETARATAEAYDLLAASPPLIVHYPPGATRDPNTGNVLDGQTYANQYIAPALKHGGIIAAPTCPSMDILNSPQFAANPEAYNWKFEFLDPGSARQPMMIDRLRYLDVLIMRGLFLPSLTATDGQFGTRAQAQVHQSVADTIADLIHIVITKEINNDVDTLLRLNFGEEAVGMVHLEPNNSADDKLVSMKAMLDKIATNPDVVKNLDVRTLMDILGIPKLPEDQVIEPEVEPMDKEDIDTKDITENQ
jgi:hypothetical protein